MTDLKEAALQNIIDHWKKQNIFECPDMNRLIIRAEQALKPSKSEVADYWEKRISQFEAKGNEDYQMIERSIELLRED